MNKEQLTRYSRHILLPEFDQVGQEKLLNSKVLLIGVGGIGSATSIYLTSAGIGELIIVDKDIVDLTNLQRQILYSSDDIGKYKVECAKKQLNALNPECRINEIYTTIDDKNLAEIAKDVDIILDATDRFATRHLINQVAVNINKPLIIASAIRYDTQIFTINPLQKEFACFECVYPQATGSLEEVCATHGVFAPAVGMIGTILAAEAIKFLLSLTTLNNQILLFNLLNYQSQKLQVKKSPNCKVCANKN